MVPKGYVGRDKKRTQIGNFGQYKKKFKKKNPQLFKKEGTAL